MSLIATLEYTDPAAMLANYARIRKQLYAPRPEPVAVVVLEPEPEPEPEPPALPSPPDHVRDWLALAPPAAIKQRLSARIMDLVCEKFAVSRIDLTSDRRTAEIVRPRQICFYLMSTCTPMSFPEVGRRMGNRDHTTALHGSRKIAALMRADAELCAVVADLAETVKQWSE